MFAKLSPHARISRDLKPLLTSNHFNWFFFLKKLHHFLLSHIKSLYVVLCWPAVENIWEPLISFPALICHLLIRLVEFCRDHVTSVAAAKVISWAEHKIPSHTWDSCKCFRKHRKHERHHRHHGSTPKTKSMKGIEPKSIPLEVFIPKSAHTRRREFFYRGNTAAVAVCEGARCFLLIISLWWDRNVLRLLSSPLRLQEETPHATWSNTSPHVSTIRATMT